MRTRLATAAVALLGVAFAVAGCGGASGSTLSGDAAQLAPPNALAFVAVDTDRGSAQLQRAQAILDKFPAKGKLVAALQKAVSASGADLATLQSSIGPELDVAVLALDGKSTAVGFTKPANEQLFDQQLAVGSKIVHTTLDGWTLFSDSQAGLDAVRQRTGNLADVHAYQSAFSSLPSDAVARAYLSPAALGQAASSLGAIAGASAGLLPASSAKWIAAGLTAHDGGLGLEIHAKGAVNGTPSFSSSLADEIPGDALLALSFDNVGKGLAQAQGAAGGALPQQLQGALGDLGTVLGGEGVVYLRAGTPIPEVTLAVKEDDPQAAVHSVDTLVGKVLGAATPTTTTIGGNAFRRVLVGPVDLLYGALDGQLVVTDSRNAVTELRSKSDRLSDNATFEAAKKAAGLPDSTKGWLYVDLADAVPVIEGFARTAGVTIPASVQANLLPLRSLVLFGSHDGDVQNLVAFLQTS